MDSDALLLTSSFSNQFILISTSVTQTKYLYKWFLSLISLFSGDHFTYDTTALFTQLRLFSLDAHIGILILWILLPQVQLMQFKKKEKKKKNLWPSNKQIRNYRQKKIIFGTISSKLLLFISVYICNISIYTLNLFLAKTRLHNWIY